MLKHLELNNFKKHEHLSVDFTAGLNGITGPNYRGKSTILLGILYCLGGSRMVPGSRIATRGTNTGFKASLRFNIPRKGDYFVTRTKTSANLIFEGDIHDEPVLVASGASPVNAAISELLGMPLRRFVQVKYAKQKAADAILKAGSAELFKIVAELTGIERIMAVQGLLENDLKVHKHIAEVLPFVELEPKHGELANLHEAIQKAIAEFQETDQAVKALDAELDGVGKQERKLSNLRNAYLDAERELRFAEMTLTSCLGREAAVTDYLRKQEARRDELCRQPGDSLLALAETWKAERDRLLQQEAEAAALKAEVASLTREVDGLWATETELLKAKHDAEDRLKRLGQPKEGRVQQLAFVLEQAKAWRLTARQGLVDAQRAQSAGACPSCSRPFEDFNPDEAEQLVQMAILNLNNAEEAITASQQDHLDAVEAEKAWTRACATLEAKASAVRDFEAHAVKARNLLAEKSLLLAGSISVGSLKERIAVLDSDIADCLKVHRELEQKAEELQVALRSTNTANEALAVAKDRMSTLTAANGFQNSDEVAGRLDELHGWEKIHRAKYDELLATRDQRRDAVNRLRTQSRVLISEIEQAEVNNRKHVEARDKVVAIEQLRNLIRGNRDRYSRQVWDVFMASASLFASTITGGYIESVSRNSEGAFTYIEEGFDMELEEASGAQLALIGCAVQMALAEAAQCPLDVVLMDEPTADMDPEHALAFSTLLAASGKQVIMVTHRELDSAVFSNTIAL